MGLLKGVYACGIFNHLAGSPSLIYEIESYMEPRLLRYNDYTKLEFGVLGSDTNVSFGGSLFHREIGWRFGTQWTEEYLHIKSLSSWLYTTYLNDMVCYSLHRCLVKKSNLSRCFHRMMKNCPMCWPITSATVRKFLPWPSGDGYKNISKDLVTWSSQAH